jgi:hypothetical protein
MCILGFIEYLAMKTRGGVELQLRVFLISVLQGMRGQLHAPAALPPGKEPLVPIG